MEDKKSSSGQLYGNWFPYLLHLPTGGRSVISLGALDTLSDLHMNDTDCIQLASTSAKQIH